MPTRLSLDSMSVTTSPPRTRGSSRIAPSPRRRRPGTPSADRSSRAACPSPRVWTRPAWGWRSRGGRRGILGRVPRTSADRRRLGALAHAPRGTRIPRCAPAAARRATFRATPLGRAQRGRVALECIPTQKNAGSRAARLPRRTAWSSQGRAQGPRRASVPTNLTDRTALETSTVDASPTHPFEDA
jgi:hypothetical protein